jgi:hypothetical protein
LWAQQQQEDQENDDMRLWRPINTRRRRKLGKWQRAHRCFPRWAQQQQDQEDDIACISLFF